ncbi:MAG: alpha/beta hydrolase [Bacteroidota bacterium]
MPIWLIILIVIILAFLLTNIVLYFIQDRFIFHSEKLPKYYEFSFKNEYDEIYLKTGDGNNLNGLLFKLKNPKGVIIIYHNHSGNVLNTSATATLFNDLNYDALIMDYRGYGKSTGKYNEKSMLDDSKLWYDFAKKYYKEDHITVMGRGIGATFATFVASENNPKRLCLGSPLFNMNYTVKFLYPYLPYQILLKYKFDTAKYIKEVKCNIYIFHGKQDELVNYTNSVKLHEVAKENSELNIIPDGNHYNLINNKIVFNRLKEILSN